MRKTILHIIDSLGSGGAELLLRETIPALKDFDHIICYLHDPEDFLPEFSSFRVYKLNFSGWGSLLKCAWKLRKILQREKVSLVHAHLLKSTWIARIAKTKKQKLLFSVHSLLSKDAFEKNRNSLWAEKILYGKDDTLIGVSNEVVVDYDRSVSRKGKAFVLHNFIRDDFFQSTYEFNWSSGSPLKCVAVGNLKEAKNYPFILKAFSHLGNVNVSLDIYGEGSLGQILAEEIRKEKLNIRIRGNVHNIIKELQQYDLFIMASKHEGYGIAAMEAMTIGLPLFLSRIPVFEEVFEDVPYYFNLNDPSSLSNALLSFYEGKMLDVKARISKGKSIAQAIATKEQYLKKLSDIYKQLLQTN